MSALGWFPKWYLIRFLFNLILKKKLGNAILYESFIFQTVIKIPNIRPRLSKNSWQKPLPVQNMKRIARKNLKVYFILIIRVCYIR